MDTASIVIPAHNQAAFVAAAVDSALAQTHAAIEVIVVDDGSTDGTAGILRGYAGRPNVTVIHQPNAGLAAARNAGFRAAQGAYVCFLDSDDYLAPAHIERLVRALDDHPGTAFAYCDVQMVDAAGVPSSEFSVGDSRPVLTGDILGSLLIGGYFPPHAVVLRRSVLDGTGAFDLDLGGHADYELWLRLAGEGHQATFVAERLAYYRVYDGSMSRDVEHMRATRIAAIERIARRSPARLAAALSRLQELAVDLHTANTWLRKEWDRAIAVLDAKEDVEWWSALEAFDRIRLVSGEPDQLGLWDVTIGAQFERALFLHPPAAVEFVIPTGAAGRLTTAFAVHPDAWTKPEACACVFSIDVDRVVASTALLNPHARLEDRRWIEAGLTIPASPSGRHVVTLETQALDSTDFGWALFRDVKFTAS